MEPFTQRMLERARARQEKIDQKLANSGQAVPKRKPLQENIIKSQASPVKSPVKAKEQVSSPRKSKEPVNCNTPIIKKVIPKSDYSSPQRVKNDIVVTKKEFKSPKSSLTRRNSDVSVEINISHRNDIQIEVQVEERDAPISITYDAGLDTANNVVIKELEDESPKKEIKAIEMETKNDKSGLRQNVKSRLDRLGNLYSDKPNLSSPIHRTEQQFTCDTPPLVPEEKPKVERTEGRRKFGRLAALADQINNWEDDLSHHSFQPDVKKSSTKEEKHESSTLDVSIHSIKDIDRALQSVKKPSKPNPAHTFIKPMNECQRLDKRIVAELESEGYRRVSASQSRLVYDFVRNRQEPKTATPSATSAPNMATLIASPVVKKPSIKKYRAPTPPGKIIDENSCDKDKENNELDHGNDENSACDKADDKPATDSPARRAVRRTSDDRGSVMSKAAMFESGSPRTREKDPAEMSLRERKALFEKNKGAAIVPKAPFGLAPSVRTLHGDKDAKKPAQRTPTKNTPEKTSSNSKDSLSEDSISQSSLGGGIKGKLAALFNKEQTISETNIANKYRQERDREMEMLQNRFHYKPNPNPKPENNESDDDNDHESEKAPLMGSTASLAAAKKPEIIANVPKSDKPEKVDEKTQPAKRRSSQDSPVVLSVLEEVKRIKVNNSKESGPIVSQPSGLYPRLSDIETDNSNSHEEYSDCGGSSTEDIKGKLDKSDNWAETSFGREVLNVVKKNNSSYKKAVQSDSDDESGACESELDELLDEALDDEGPTPPKVNKVIEDNVAFKSPLKTPARDRANELVHSVSFYRKMQASSTPTTPMRVIRHVSPERDFTPEVAPVTTVRQRIKELHNEINKQQTVISQASQALNLCAATIEFSGSTEQAEGERLLLLATHRRQACLHEVQRLQVEGAGPAATAGKATLNISNLRIPLRRDYIRQLNADGAVGHHVVCLLKCRDRVLATSMQLTKPNAPLQFPDEIRMEGLNGDFKVTVEIYLLQASKEILPHNVKYHITNKKSGSKLLTPKSKVSELKAPRVVSPGGPLSVRSPQFALHGYCIFALQQAARKSFTLNKVPPDSPLEGSISTDISARVLVPQPEPHAAFLTAFDDVSGLGAWHRRWVRLQPPRLTYWKYPDDVTKKMPIGDIDLTTIISEKAVKAPRDLCARPHTILLEASAPPGLDAPEGGSLVYVRGPNGSVIRRHLLAADTAADRDVWLDKLNQALEYVRCAPSDSE
ncbi:anillin-like isoform X3 [Danaus plexippus]|uniref:anillin-like isoform X3 n=1 Tax=Danaus plexippus TaxID=13037 RepID=UPI002AB29D57|nr:anillin-like isoform X3 [Danaus plexippus]